MSPTPTPWSGSAGVAASQGLILAIPIEFSPALDPQLGGKVEAGRRLPRMFGAPCPVEDAVVGDGVELSPHGEDPEVRVPQHHRLDGAVEVEPVWRCGDKGVLPGNRPPI